MNLGEQAARRVELARVIGAEPRRWIVTSDAELTLVAQAAPGVWSGDGALLHGIPLERGQPRSEWGLELVLAPRA